MRNCIKNPTFGQKSNFSLEIKEKKITKLLFPEAPEIILVR